LQLEIDALEHFRFAAAFDESGDREHSGSIG
jgi:hypothetical protein